VKESNPFCCSRNGSQELEWYSHWNPLCDVHHNNPTHKFNVARNE